MTINLRYGATNKKDNKSQYIYIRIKHNDLTWIKTLKIKIDCNDWDFKKGEITHKHSFGNPIHSKNLKEINEKVNNVLFTLKHKAESFAYTNRLELKEWAKENNRSAFREECEEWYNEYIESKQVVRQPYIIDIYKNYLKQKFETNQIGEKRFQRMMNIYWNLYAFEQHFGKRIRTDKLTLDIWINEMIPYFRDEYEHGMYSQAVTKEGKKKSFKGIGLSDDTIKLIKSALKSTAINNKKHYNFNDDILDRRFTIAPESKAKLFLNANQVKSILEYNGKGISTLDNKKWFFNMLYYGCFRISEVYLSIEGKTPKQVWENEIEKHPNAKGELVYYWKCANLKQNGEIHTKNLPMFTKLGDLLFGGFKNAESGNFPKAFPRLLNKNAYRKSLKAIANDLGIEGRIISHTMRRSFLNNLKKKDLTHSDLMQYSGHQTEAALLHYLNSSDNIVPTNANLNQ